MGKLITYLTLFLSTFCMTQNYMPVSQTWFKANAGVLNSSYSTANNGDPVYGWEDNSTNNWDAQNGSSNSYQPIFLNAPNSNINYNPCIYFDGTDDKLDLGNHYPFSQTNGITYFVVVQPDFTNKQEAFVFDFGSYANKGYGLTHSSNSSVHYSSVAAGNGGAVSNNTHNFSTEPIILKYEIEFGVEQRIYYQGEYIPSDKEPISLSNLNAQAVAVQNANAASKGPFTIGRQSKNSGLSSNNIRAFQGKIMEIIGIEDILNQQESRTIESYLALKYSITIDNTGYNTGQPLLNYRASDGTNLYSVYADPSYYNEIIGIGLDEYTGFEQKQSHTSNDEFRIYLDNLAPTNTSNSANFNTNGSWNNIHFLVSGNNQGATYATTSAMMEKPSSLFSRVEREWKIKNTNFSGGFNIDLALGNYALNSGINVTDLRLLIDDDGDFSDAQVYSSASGINFSLNGNMLTVSNIQDSLIPTNTTKFFTIGSIGVGTPLAVNLNSFTAEFIAQKPRVKLTWETLTESNNAHFILEKSVDAKHWKNISTIPSSGNSQTPQHYTFIDYQVQPRTYYYKLSYLTLDGEKKELKIESVHIPPKTTKTNEVKLFPNPAQTYINIETDFTDDKHILVFNSMGFIENNITILPINKNTIQLNISELQRGIYYINIDGKSFKFTRL